MRFIRDIINEKRTHAAPDTPTKSETPFAAEPDVQSEQHDHGMEVDTPKASRQSLDRGQVDESALRDIFMDAEVDEDPHSAVQAGVNDEAQDHLHDETEDLQAHSRNEVAPDTPFEDLQGWDFAATGEAADSHDQFEGLVEDPVEDLAQDTEWETAQSPMQPSEDVPSPAVSTDTAAAAPSPMAPPTHAETLLSAQTPREELKREEPNMSDAPVEVPQPAAGRSVGRSGRVKTRVLGFGQPQDPKLDVFSAKAEQKPQTPSTYPVGWLVVVEGPGQGSAFTLHDGVASIGRGEDQTVALAFGDNSISRENHAAIAYDDEQRSFFLGHGGKTNLVRLNGRPVLSTEELKSDDLIRIGETTMRFVALCGAAFSWSGVQKSGAGHVAAE